MSEKDGLFRWQKRSLAVRIAFIVVFSAVFLYAGLAGNPLAMRIFNFGLAALVFAWGGWVLNQSGVGVTVEAAAAACLLASGSALGYSSIVALNEGLSVFGDNETVLTDIGTLLLFVGFGLDYLSIR